MTVHQFLSAFYTRLANILTTKGDILTFDTTEVRLPVGTDGQVITADSTEDKGIKWADQNVFTKIVKTADESVNNSEVLQDDDELFFTPTINKTYYIQYFAYAEATAVADFKEAWTIPTGATMTRFSGDWDTQVKDAVTDTTTPVSKGMNTLVRTYTYYMRLIMDSTAGNVNFQFAQNTQEVSDTKCLKGATIIVYEEGTT